MYLQPDAHQPADEYRRYFPDWTDRPLKAGEELEADHSSYLAGGYAEEFGFLAQAESWRGVRFIAGDSPDDDALRLVQWGGIHPGYPLRPHPISVDRERTTRRRSPSPSAGDVSKRGEFEAREHGEFFRITERPYEREHRQPAHRLAAAAMRFLAAVAALRRGLPSLRAGRRR
jgi:hypothetical protein